jgi:Leucine-rich repeat (LRR) protein
MEGILSSISPDSYAVDTFDLSGNSLTYVPTSLVQYTQLISLSLATNSITEIKAGDLTLSDAVISLDLSSNSITQIASGSLPS